ncbi:MAG: response regulator transcription factor [Candidatus Promineifilaceae bacterium]
MPIKVLICDDQAIIRDGLEMMLKLERDIDVIGKAEDGLEAVTLAEQLLPDLALMDLKMPGMTGVEATRQIQARFPQVKVLVLTTYDDDEWLFDAIRAGAAGYLLKDTPREKVVEAIRGTVAGKSFMDPAVTGRLLAQVSSQQAQPVSPLLGRLTEREVDVLRLIARGLSNGEIAERLHLSEGTVRNHVSAIFTKLDVPDRTNAAIVAIQSGL